MARGQWNNYRLVSMGNQNIPFSDIGRVVSAPRLSAYLSRCGQNPLDGLAAYGWNVQLSQSLYPVLQVLEVALRNALNDALIEDCQNENWFDGFFLNIKEQKAIQQAKDTLVRQHKQIDANRIVSELHFGFWTSLLDVRYEHQQILWPRLLSRVFPAIPKSLRTRHHISNQLNRIRKLRNRIFHYEPIWHWRDLPQQYQSILDLLKWLSPIACQHIILLDNFRETYQHGLARNRNLIIKNFLNPEDNFSTEIILKI